MSHPAIKKGMLVRVVAPNFYWLRDNEGMLPAPKGSILTVIAEPTVLRTFVYYPVLHGYRVITLMEPSVNFHLDQNMIRIFEEKST